MPGRVGEITRARLSEVFGACSRACSSRFWCAARRVAAVWLFGLVLQGLFRAGPCCGAISRPLPIVVGSDDWLGDPQRLGHDRRATFLVHSFALASTCTALPLAVGIDVFPADAQVVAAETVVGVWPQFRGHALCISRILVPADPEGISGDNASGAVRERDHAVPCTDSAQSGQNALDSTSTGGRSWQQTSTVLVSGQGMPLTTGSTCCSKILDQ